MPHHTLKVTNLEFHSSKPSLSFPANSYVQWLVLPQSDFIRGLRLSMVNAVLAQSFLHSLSTTPLPLKHLVMPHDPKSLIRMLHDMPATATEHLTTLSIQVAYATDALLKAIFSSFVRVEDLTLMVLLKPTGLSVSRHTDEYTAHDFLAALSILKLPSSIKSLHFGFSQTYTPIGVTDNQDKLFLLKERLFLSYHALERIRFDFSGSYASWTRVD